MNTEIPRLWKLQISQGDSVGQIFPLRDHTRLGREPDYEIVLEDEQISRFHAVIKKQEDSLIITDQNSTSGTFVNDERIDSPTKLHQGDKIKVGETHFLVDREESTPDTGIGVPPPQGANSPKFAKSEQSDLPPKKGKSKIILISIILFIVGCLCIFSLALGGYLYYQYKNTTQTTDLAVDIRDFMAVSTVEIESGGTIVIPDDALLEVSKISVDLASTPLLPDGVEPVGEALSITAPTVPQIPVTLRLPIPESVTNPENLVIIRVESDGTTTFLMTDVDGNELVATTPGFSNFIVAQLTDARKVGISGKQKIRPGQREQYYVNPFKRESREINGAIWSVAGEAMLVNNDNISAIVQADQQEGSAILSFKVIDQYGYRWFGTRFIEVTNNSELYTSDFGVSIILYPAVVEPGENVQIVAEVYGDFEVPLTWSWEYGDGTTGSASSELTRFDFPPKTFNADENRYIVSVRVEDTQGRSG
ncbi:MAG: FHA domain-containing protein, partial [Anaerolineales bacterium]|nr:FHA domain-containing protein [Anaerolineales bacterium]